MEYLPQQPPQKFSLRWWHLTTLKCGIGYCLVSIVTLPFSNLIWLGELPVLLLFQGPKIFLANWLRKNMVMEVIKMLGFSSGSFSPDYSLARPYALGLAYSIPMILVSLSLLLPGGSSWRHRRLALLFFTLLLVDGLLVYLLSNRRPLSFY